MHDDFVPVFRPLLPPAEAVARYLAVLDASRWYANHGELADALEARLSALFSIAPGLTIAASSGTAALTGAILAIAGRATADRPLCLVAGYGFVATALAAEQCGFRVRFVDVDAASWALDAERLGEHPALGRTGVVVATAPYGRPFTQAAWTRFTQRSGVPAVIDAAAGIEALADTPGEFVGATPVVLSLHATKAFGVGEGGAIVSADPNLARSARAALNFGFDGMRTTTGPGLNGKMSEYHAAVGLAELDGWPAKRAAFRRVAEAYRRSAAVHGLTIHATPHVSSNYVLFEAASGSEARAAEASLARRGIDYRLWYGRGLHREPYLRSAERDPLPVVEELAPRLVGLPVAPDLADAVIDRIVAALAEAGDG